MSVTGPGSATPATHVDPGTSTSTTTTTTPGTGTSGTVSRTGGGARLAVTASVTGTTQIPELRLASDAVTYVEGALARLSSAQATAARRLLVLAGGIDGNAVLTKAEAEKVLGPVLRALPDGGAAITRALAGADAEIEAERKLEAEVREGVDVMFNSDKDEDSLSGRVVEELEAAVAEAAGRPLDVNVMIFSFTDEAIADKLQEIARQHPNAHIRIIADWTQTTTSNGYKPAVLARAGLSNLEVKFKKDQPYKLDAATGRLKWDHQTSRGLNHHKGLVTLIDGQPRKLVAGSFNWSPTADNQNYENLMVLDAGAAANRTVMRHYEEEFEAYWNEGKATLTLDEAADHRRLVESELRSGTAPAAVKGLESGAGASLKRLAPDDVLDLNDGSAAARIADLFGGGQAGLDIARAMHAERLNYGRFRDVEDLVDRIPAIGTLGTAALDRIGKQAIFGDGLVSVNEAGAAELMAVGLTRAEADAIIAAREAAGDLPSLDAARTAAGLSAARWTKLSRHLTDDVRRVSFSSRAADDAAAATGYAKINADRTVPVTQPDGSVVLESATLGSGAIDILRRAKSGETVKLAVYGLSANTPEYAALVEAARRGVKVRAVLNRAGNEGVAASLRGLAQTERLDIGVKVSGRTMHQKYLVHVEGEDAFNGSANLSGSSTTRHSEDRFFMKNSATLAKAFEADFDRLWTRLPG